MGIIFIHLLCVAGLAAEEITPLVVFRGTDLEYARKEFGRKVIDEADATFRRNKRVIWEECMKVFLGFQAGSA